MADGSDRLQQNARRATLGALVGCATPQISWPRLLQLGPALGAALASRAHSVSAANSTEGPERPKILDRPFSQQMQTLRQSQARPFDLSTGRLGNLRSLHIHGENLAVIIRPGKENRVTRGSQSVAIDPLQPSTVETLDPKPQDLKLTLTKPAPVQGAWVLIEVATLQDLYMASIGPDTTLWLDRVKLPWLRVMGHLQSMVLTDVDLGHLHLDVNGQGAFIASGQAQSVFASAQTPGAKFYLQNLSVALQTQVMPKNVDQLYALKVDPTMKAFYDSPVQTGGNTKRFPVEVKGDLKQLLFSGPGRADVKPLSASTDQEAQRIHRLVVGRFPV